MALPLSADQRFDSQDDDEEEEEDFPGFDAKVDPVEGDGVAETLGEIFDRERDHARLAALLLNAMPGKICNHLAPMEKILAMGHR